jgi:hypothetical protein
MDERRHVFAGGSHYEGNAFAGEAKMHALSYCGKSLPMSAFATSPGEETCADCKTGIEKFIRSIPMKRDPNDPTQDAIDEAVRKLRERHVCAWRESWAAPPKLEDCLDERCRAKATK